MSKMRGEKIGVLRQRKGRQIKGVRMKLYVGIDIAKHDFAPALELADGSLKRSTKKLENNKRGWNTLKNWALKQQSECQADMVHLGVEATGGYETPMVEWLREHSDAAGERPRPKYHNFTSRPNVGGRTT